RPIGHADLEPVAEDDLLAEPLVAVHLAIGELRGAERHARGWRLEPELVAIQVVAVEDREVEHEMIGRRLDGVRKRLLGWQHLPYLGRGGQCGGEHYRARYRRFKCALPAHEASTDVAIQRR